MIGHRSGGNWTFYFQEYSSLGFEVREVSKLGPKPKYRQRWLMDYTGLARRQYNVNAILNYGELWPNKTGNQETF